MMDLVVHGPLLDEEEDWSAQDDTWLCRGSRKCPGTAAMQPKETSSSKRPTSPNSARASDQHTKGDERTELSNLFLELFIQMWRQKDQT